MHIRIIEGPSGAGKSTFIAQKITEGPGITAVSSSLSANGGPRLNLNAEEMAITSMANDVYKAGLALEKINQGYHTVYIDRMYLSQIVYHTIRTDTDDEFTWMPGQVTTLLSQIYRIFVFARSQLVNRGLDVPHADMLNIQMKLMCPDTYIELQKRRESSPREYPAGMRDWRLYKRIKDTKDFATVPEFAPFATTLFGAR